MRVVVTGAAGRLGSIVVPFLLEHGREVVAIDRRPGTDARFPIVECDLRDASRLPELLEGAEALVHLAGKPYLQPPSKILNNNIVVAVNLLQAARETGIAKLIYASSVQVFASEGGHPPEVSYLPLDGNTPANPRNPYACSKAAEELLFREHSRRESAQVVVLRFPGLLHASGDPAWGGRLASLDVDEPAARIAQGFSALSFHDAARLVHACLESFLPGFRIYFPAVSMVAREDILTYVRRYYSTVVHREGVAGLESLVDISEIERDTGWRPEDHCTQRPPGTRPLPSTSRLRSVIDRLRQKLQREG